MTDDLLTATLQDFGMTSVFYAASELAAPWGIAMPPLPTTLVFHLVTRGRAVVLVDGSETALEPGGLLLVTQGAGHVIADDPATEPTPLFDLPREEVSERYERIRVPGEGPATELLCGAVGFTGLGVDRLVSGLPPVLVVEPAPHDRAWLRSAVEVIGAESRHPRPGSDVVTARLADVLVVHAVRAWLEQHTPDRGWVAALRDPAVSRALAAVHAEPARPWTLELLAREAGMSRSSFAARFTALMGEPVMAYVTSWRMDLAARLVREGGLPLARIAERVGYQSEAAFNRAFRRAFGLTPGAFGRRTPVAAP